MDLSFSLRVFTLLLVGYCYAEVTVEIQPAKDSVTKKVFKGSFTFLCEVKGLAEGETADIKWKDPRDDVIGEYSKNPEDIRNRIYVMQLFPNKVTLQFENLTGDPDAGGYTCEGFKGSELLGTKEIKVLLSKEITVSSPSEQFPVVNTTSVIECKTSFKNSPTVVWLNGSNMKPIELTERYQQVATGLKIKNITQADNGVYVCYIIGEESNTKSFRIKVTVTVPPRMKGPATMHPDPVVGKPFALTCIADGTPKPDFKFQKGGVTLEGGRYEVIVNKNPQIEQSEGILKIKELVDTDRGDYVCIAQNRGGTVQQTVMVDVQVPPIVEPIGSATGNAGQPGSLTCQAKGNPEPSLQWKITGTDISINEDQEKGISLAEKVEQEKDIFVKKKTLKFESLKAENTNNYTCVATNPAGTDQKIGAIVVWFKPNFKDSPYTATYGWLNHDTEIKCVVNAVPAPDIYWYIGNTQINQGGPYKITQKEGIRQRTSILTVSVNIGNEGEVFKKYTCRAQNQLSANASTFDIVLKKALAPKAASVSFGAVTPTSIELVIKPPADNGGQPVLDYKIEYHPQGQKDNVSKLNAEVNETEALVEYETVTKFELVVGSDPRESRSRSDITGLKAKTQYVITVWPRNNVGYGQEFTVSQETDPLSVPGTPTILSKNNVIESKAITLVWKRPNTGGAPITGYTIKYTKVEMKNENEVLKYHNTVTKPVNGDKTSYKLSGLEANADYEVQLVAINRIGGSMASTLYFKTLQAGVVKLSVEKTDPHFIYVEKTNEQFDNKIAKTGGGKEVIGSADTVSQNGAIPRTPGAKVDAAKDDKAGPQMATGAIIGILIAVIIILFIVIDVTFYFTKQCGLLWTLKGKVTGEEGGESRADPETVDHEKEAFIKDGKQDSEEPSAKENVDVVNETEKTEEKERELEPEDKEEKLDTAPEPAEEVKETSSPATETAPTDPSVETAPPATTPDADKDPKV